MKCTAKTLKSLNGCYEIVSEEKVTKVVTKHIPEMPGFFGGGFPQYLKGFEEYYKHYHSGWVLLPQYLDKVNRPCYTLEVLYTLYDVEFTSKGKELIQKRYDMHKHAMEKYAKLLK